MLWKLLRFIFFAQPCFSCQKLTYVSNLCGICLSCARSRRKEQNQMRTQTNCPRCGKPHSGREEPICETRNIFFSELQSLQSRLDWEREVFQICKFQNQILLCSYFSFGLTKIPAPFWRGIDAIVPVPSLDKKTGRWFHPACALLQRISRKRKIPIWDLLEKRSREKQSQKKFGERFLHAKKAWTLRRPDRIANGKHILVVDDVTTTSASLNEIARILLLAGAGSVRCLVLLRSEDGVDGDSSQERHKDNQIFRSDLEGRF